MSEAVRALGEKSEKGLSKPHKRWWLAGLITEEQTQWCISSVPSDGA